MKYLLLMILCVGCSNCYETDVEKNISRLEQEVVKFCSCHLGLDVFTAGGGKIIVYCKDSARTEISLNTRIDGTLILDSVVLGGGCTE